MSGPTASPDALEAFCVTVLKRAGADVPSAEAAARAMLHASLHGVDSHGVRLLPHYNRAIRGGRVNGTPALRFRRTRLGAGMLNADHAHGALATYEAGRHAVALAEEAGIGAVGIAHTSHFGPAGAYALPIAEAGKIGIVVCNSDSFVRLHDGASRFHGTNPIAVAVPTNGPHPWLLDMATSAVPYNRVALYKTTGETLPDHTASRADGTDTRSAHETDMLAPLGGAVGFKGAGLGGMVEIFSALLTGMRIGPEILPMDGPDMATPRDLGAFVIAVDPDAFAGADILRAGMDRYLRALRDSPPREGARVMAPGDREWAEAGRRRVSGIPLDHETAAAFKDLAAAARIPAPFSDPTPKQTNLEETQE
ncbi:MAG: Ldh family oxidoreductase [Pseudomonadota bacterium]